jgi:hypothetical protein
LAYREKELVPDEAVSLLIDAADREIREDVVGWDRAPRCFVMLALQRLRLA